MRRPRASRSSRASGGSRRIGSTSYIFTTSKIISIRASSAHDELARLRDEGVVGAIGIGSNLARACRRPARPRAVRRVPARRLLHAARRLGSRVDRGGARARRGRRRRRRVQLGRSRRMAAARRRRSATSRRRLRSSRAPRGLPSICERHGVPLAAAALQFVLANPAITTVLIGPRTVAELDANLAAAECVRSPMQLWADLARERALARARTRRREATLGAVAGRCESTLTCISGNRPAASTTGPSPTMPRTAATSCRPTSRRISTLRHRRRHFVQTAPQTAETDWLIDVTRERASVIYGVTGWVDLAGGECDYGALLARPKRRRHSRAVAPHRRRAFVAKPDVVSNLDAAASLRAQRDDPRRSASLPRVCATRSRACRTDR